jgi:flavin-binding protein dodecin
MPDLIQASQVKALHKEKLLTRPHVVGVGVGYKQTDGRKTDEISLVVLVRQKLSPVRLAPDALVPREVDGLRTDVIQVGELRPFLTHTDRWRPAPGGVSLGHYQITAGTLGAVVRDRATGDRLILSNNHVLANTNAAQIGDAILQPGPYDGGTVANDTIAHLERFSTIQFAGSPSTCGIASSYAAVGNAVARLLGSHHHLEVTRVDAQAVNLVDAAVARPVQDSDVLDEIYEIGTVSGTVPAQLGMAVRKSGRTTALTTGQIDVMDATVSVSYDAGRTATFEGQLVAGPMSQGGDSGSLFVAGDSLKAVGLLFAGSDQTTIFNPIQAVLDALAVTI